MPETEPSRLHEPVMADECIEMLDAADGGLFVDATLGLGGHTERILRAAADNRVIGIDQDAEALGKAAERLREFGERFTPVKGNFSDLDRLVPTEKFGRPAGILADIGVSSLQLDSEVRGFSFRFDAPLDMRMAQDEGRETAAEMLERLTEAEIANIIYEFGEERASRKIARWIVERRERGEAVATTFELANLVRRAVRTSPKDKIDPATRTFQALRIAVNDELGSLDRFIDAAVELLAPGGILAIITFHSLEDRMVKRMFLRLSGKCECPPRIPKCVCGASKRVDILTRKPVIPTQAEIDRNPRSRSAKLRVCRKS